MSLRQPFTRWSSKIKTHLIQQEDHAATQNSEKKTLKFQQETIKND